MRRVWVGNVRITVPASIGCGDGFPQWKSNWLLTSANGERRGVLSFDGWPDISSAGLTPLRRSPRAAMTYLIAVVVNQVWVE